MQIIIPMTGHGSRFVNAGYKALKPFINVLGEPIISWIIKKMFPDEQDIIFVCRTEHLNSIPNMEKTLKDICPTAKIFAIDNWFKKGPVYDVMKASKLINDEKPSMINYCDFYAHWNWEELKKNLIAKNCDGSIPCYTGFHPHLLESNNIYASCKVDNNQNLLEIKEKFSFENNKEKSYHSSGSYYFKSGALLKKYCQSLIDDDINLNGEYYASLPFNNMVADGLKVWVPSNIEYFCQWGTPFDLEEFLFWINRIKNFNN